MGVELMPLPVYLIHFDAPEWCADAVRSIEKSEPPVAVTVIDNGGRELDVDCRVFHQERNDGYTGGANAALRDWLAGDEPWCVIGSHDLHVAIDTFARMLADAGDAGIVGPTIAGCRAHLVDGAVEWLSGTCLMIRRECAEAVGGFDERFGSYVEDVDYCLRTTAIGWRLVQSDAPVQSLGSSVGSLASRRMIQARALLLRWKHGGFAAELGRALKVVASNVVHGHWSLARVDILGVIDGLSLCARARFR
jgi:hypothetical protein